MQCTQTQLKISIWFSVLRFQNTKLTKIDNLEIKKVELKSCKSIKITGDQTKYLNLSSVWHSLTIENYSNRIITKCKQKWGKNTSNRHCKCYSIEHGILPHQELADYIHWQSSKQNFGTWNICSKERKICRSKSCMIHEPHLL